MKPLRVPQAFQYQGSKRALAHRILSLFPNTIGTLHEPFSGSAAISLAAAAEGKAKHFAINDLNAPLISLLKNMVDSPQRVADRYAEIWQQQGSTMESSLSHYNQVRDMFNREQDAVHLLYLLSRCVKGAVRYNREGKFNQSPDKRRRGTRPMTMRSNIEGVSHLLKGRSSFTSLDYAQALYCAQPGDLVYMDPPYQGVSNDRDARYIAGLDFDRFVSTLADLNARDVPFIVSFDGSLGGRHYGQSLPESLNLQKLALVAGRSSTATLLGRHEITVEALYLSPTLHQTGLKADAINPCHPFDFQLDLLDECSNEAKVLEIVH